MITYLYFIFSPDSRVNVFWQSKMMDLLTTRHNKVKLDAFVLQNDIDFSTSEDESSDNKME